MVRLCFGVKLFVIILWDNFLCFLVVSYCCQPGSEEFNRSFQVAAAMFPDDPIANLNAGAMEIQKGGDLTTAKKHLAKADQKAPETLNNLGVIALLEGDYDAAEKYFNAAKEYVVPI